MKARLCLDVPIPAAGHGADADDALGAVSRPIIVSREPVSSCAWYGMRTVRDCLRVRGLAQIRYVKSCKASLRSLGMVMEVGGSNLFFEEVGIGNKSYEERVGNKTRLSSTRVGITRARQTADTLGMNEWVSERLSE